MSERTTAGIVSVTALLAMMGGCTFMAEYKSCAWGRGAGHSRGDTKNTIATFVTAAAANKMAPGAATIDVVAEKYFWPDARITGRTTPYSIDVKTSLWWSHNNFHGLRRADGMLDGEIDKPGLDWRIVEQDRGVYAFKALWYIDMKNVRLSVDRGYIDGTYDYPVHRFFSFGRSYAPWSIRGRYDESGNIRVVIDTKDSFNVVLNGKITKK